MRDLKYKFVNYLNYKNNYEDCYPFAPSNLDRTEFLICGVGDLNESQMNAYKVANWPKPDEEVL
ncbi:hypothetical protein [Vibrio sp. MEBiC08052]|uniref:hypothetical protein n=1 Tax=Vibrio sp. MEBiC08052 TaxID=1761910 RepID=UPI0007405E1E|nr:hypothetical protein [Vibrio sp. MEBiC08052]KUI97158.1 hypothetical protein VRK_37420 [Vibrio sp. MEBiC08052]